MGSETGQFIVGRPIVAGEARGPALVLDHGLSFAMGFDVAPSCGNFLFARCKTVREAKRIFAGLRKQRVLVRYFATPELANGLRITVGTDDQINELLRILRKLTPGGTERG